MWELSSFLRQKATSCKITPVAPGFFLNKLSLLFLPLLFVTPQCFQRVVVSHVFVHLFIFYDCYPQEEQSNQVIYHYWKLESTNCFMSCLVKIYSVPVLQHLKHSHSLSFVILYLLNNPVIGLLLKTQDPEISSLLN